MALPRYQQGKVAVQGGMQLGADVQAQKIEGFVNSLEGFKRGALSDIRDDSISQAKKDAESAFAEGGIRADQSEDASVYGEQYNMTLNNMHAKQLTVDTNNVFDNIYEEHKNNPASFEEVSNEHYKATSNMLPEHLKADYAINFEASKSRYKNKVSANRIRLDRERDYALTDELFMQSKDNATQMMREGNKNGALFELNKGIKALDEALENGTIDAVKHSQGTRDIQHNVSRANFKSINDRNIASGDLENAQAFIEDFRKTTIDEIYGFDDERREKLADEMQRDLNVELRRLENESSSRSKYDNKLVKDQIFLLDNAEDVTNEEIDEGLRSNAKPELKEKLLIAKHDNIILADFNTLNLEDQVSDIYDMRATKKTADDVRLLKKKEKLYKKAQAEIKKNLLGYGEGKAFKTELKPISMQDEDFMLDIDERVEQVNLTSEYVKRPVGFFQPSEVQDIKSRLSLMNTNEKIDLIQNINQLPDDIRRPTYAQFKNEIGFAGDLFMSGNTEASRVSLMGKGSDVEIGAGFKIDVMSKLDNIYAFDSDTTTFNRDVEGIMNYARGKKLEGEEINYKEAVEQSVGIIDNHNGQSFYLPQGVDKGDFDTFLDNVVIEGQPELTKGINNMSDMFGSGDYQLLRVSPGQYKIRVLNNGNPYIIDTEEGEDFILDYNELTK